MLNQSFFRYLEFEKRFSKHTIVAYQNDLDQYAAYIKMQYELDDLNLISHTFIRSWIVSMMDAGMKSKSINRKISSLKTYYKFLQREGLISQSPMQKIISPKTPKRLPQFVEQSQMESLLDEVDFEDSFEGYRDRLIIEVFYATGIRVSELVGLKTKNVDTSRMFIKVLGKRNKERIIPISSELITTIEVYNRYKDDKGLGAAEYFFVRENGEQMYTKKVYRMVNSELTKVTSIQKKSPHVLRHTFATHMLNNGAELNAIKEILGHSSLAATQVYTHNSIEKLKSIYKQAHPKG
jgi:integrase/recombinase XerC